MIPTIETPDAPTEADRDWWASEANPDEPGHDPDIPTADIPGVEPPGEDDDDPGWVERAEVATFMGRYESGWA